MARELLLKAVEALESGKYEQCRTTLRCDSSFCALGAILDAVGNGVWREMSNFELDRPTYYYYEENGNEMLDLFDIETFKTLGLTASDLGAIIKLSDRHEKSFADIAKWIRINKLGQSR